MQDTVLNYMWLETRQPKSAEDEADLEMCLENIRDIAQSNSDFDIIIWVGEKTNPKVQHVVDITPNIVIKKLDKIDKYRELSSMRSDENLWVYLDLTRLYIIDHAIRKMGYQNAIYSDMDIDLQKIDLATVTEKLNDFGTFAAMLIDPKVETPILENSFLGFSQNGHSLLLDELIPQTELAFRQKDEDGYAAYQRYFHRLFPQMNRGGQITGTPVINIQEIPTHRVKNRYADVIDRNRNISGLVGKVLSGIITNTVG